jgi:hypothetical protein
MGSTALGGHNAAFISDEYERVKQHKIRQSSRAFVPLKGQCHEIFCFWFFHESVSPQPQCILLRAFQIFSTICGDICKSRCTTGINDTSGKFATGVNDTGGKIAAGINDTGGKFATGINDTGEKFSD